MPSNIISRNLINLCFSKLRRPPPTNQPSSSPCTPTSKDNPTPTPTATTTSSSDNQIVVKNFNSLYDFTTATATTTSGSPTTTSCRTDSSSSFDSDDTDPTATALSPSVVVDFAAVFSSQRFFFSLPGRSNSIFDSPETDALIAGAVPFQTFSPDPYLDFRRSMQEMVEARNLFDVRANWDGLHELLSCYLHLNPKHIHKFIIRAFADLLLSLATASTSSSMSGATAGGGCPESDHVPASNRCKISLQLI